MKIFASGALFLKKFKSAVGVYIPDDVITLKHSLSPSLPVYLTPSLRPSIFSSDSEAIYLYVLVDGRNLEYPNIRFLQVYSYKIKAIRKTSCRFNEIIYYHFLFLPQFWQARWLVMIGRSPRTRHKSLE